MKKEQGTGGAGGGVKSYELELEWADYFLNNSDRIMDVKQSITDEDMLKLRRETSGAQRLPFKFGQNNLTMVDVGGQIHERTTWEAEFSDVLAVIYMVSLAGNIGLHLSIDIISSFI